jgi:DNA-binding MarR family transcriptional regulator
MATSAEPDALAGALLAALMKLFAPTQHGDARRPGLLELSASQHAVLDRLIQVGDQRVTDLASAEHVALPTMSVAVRRLSLAGLVHRSPGLGGNRGARVRVTPEGRRVYQASADRKTRRIQQRLSALTDAQRHDLSAAVEILGRLADDGRTLTV